MQLPYASAVDRNQIVYKLETYALNFSHTSGKHKARLFRSKLGITLENKETLVDALMRAALISEAIYTTTDQYGDRYIIDFSLEAIAGTSVIRSAWIVSQSEMMPRLTSVYPI